MPEPAENEKPLDLALLAYAAGVIDCDGCIWISRYARKSGRMEYVMRVNVTNTRRELCQWFTQLFGFGFETSAVKHKDNPKWKPTFRYVATGKQAAALLRLVLPYLVIKRRQALLALEFASTHVPPGIKLPDNFLGHRERIYHEMRKLNAKGKA